MSKRAKLAAVFGGLFCLWAVGCLVAEFGLVAQGEPPFTTFWREVWATEPWTILLVVTLLALAIGFLGGHFFGAKRSTYDRIRNEADWGRLVRADPLGRRACEEAARLIPAEPPAPVDLCGPEDGCPYCGSTKALARGAKCEACGATK